MVCTNPLSRETEPRVSEFQMLGNNHNEVRHCVLDAELEQIY